MRTPVIRSNMPTILAIAVLATLLLLTLAAIGCSPEPEVVEKIVEVEVIREVEVPVEVEKIVEVEVIKEVEVPVEVVKEVIKEVEVEVVKEVVKVERIEVPVEVIREVEVIKEVPVGSTTAPTAPTPRLTAAPTPMVDSNAHITLSAGGYHNCALRENGEAVCWGWNEYGQLNSPEGQLAAISAGWFTHTCGLHPGGEAVCWGDNEDFQSSSPDGSFMAISAGGGHTCALRENGEAVCWGDNSYGQSDPPGGSFTAISAGGWHTCALRENGEAVCWGDNDDGESDPPGGSFVAISAARYHTCGLRPGGRVACWGRNENGRATPPGGSFVAISAGSSHNCGLRPGGEVACWGDNSYGQSKTVKPASPFVAISAGGVHTCGLQGNGKVLCWGRNKNGQSNSPSGLFAVPSARAFYPGGSSASFDAASILARFSTTDAIEGEKRATAASEIIARHKSGDVDTAESIDLLHTMMPELSLDERRRAAAELARLSEDDEWDDATTAEAVFYLASLVTGSEPNPRERVAAATELVNRYETGNLDDNTALNLMDTIAPELGINERRRAAGSLARLAAEGSWSRENKMRAASETFRLVTGVPARRRG